MLGTHRNGNRSIEGIHDSSARRLMVCKQGVMSHELRFWKTAMARSARVCSISAVVSSFLVVVGGPCIDCSAISSSPFFMVSRWIRMVIVTAYKDSPTQLYTNPRWRKSRIPSLCFIIIAAESGSDWQQKRNDNFFCGYVITFLPSWYGRFVSFNVQRSILTCSFGYVSPHECRSDKSFEVVCSQISVYRSPSKNSSAKWYPRHWDVLSIKHSSEHNLS